MKKKNLLVVLSTLATACLVGGVAFSLPTPSAVSVRAENPSDLALDFSESAHSGEFTPAQNHYGWKTENGKLVPDTSVAQTAQLSYTTKSVALNEQKYISLDFYTAGQNFDVALIPSACVPNDLWTKTAIALHACVSANTNVLQLNTYLDVPSETWLADAVVNCFDGNAHKLEIFSDGSYLTFKLDGTQIYADKTVAIPANEVNIAIRANKGAYVDNLYIADSAPTVTENGTKNFDFTYASDAGNFTALALDGFVQKDGKFYPAQAGTLDSYQVSAVQYNQPISLTGTKYISLDFKATANQFDVGLLGTSEVNMWGKSLTAHVPDHSGVFSVTNNIDVGDWLGGMTATLTDGNVHTLEIFVANGKVSYKLDGITPVLDTAKTEFDIPAEEVYLVIRSAGIESFIDNLYIGDSKPTSSSVNWEFDKVSDGNNFAIYGESAGWSMANGVYKPNASWASVNTLEKIDFTTDKEISFDVYLPEGSAEKQFNVGLFADTQTATEKDTGVSFSFGPTVWINSNFSRNGETWVSECVADYYTGGVYQVKLQIENKNITLVVNGQELVFLTNGAEFVPAVNADETYLLLQATSVDTYIDNLRIGEITENTPTVTPNPDDSTSGDTSDSGSDSGSDSSSDSSSDNTGDTEDKTYQGYTSLDFSDATHGDIFSAFGCGGWSVSEGKYVANELWGSVQSVKKFDLTKNQQISFDVYLSSADEAKQFNIGFIENPDQSVAGAGTGVCYSLGTTLMHSSTLGRTWVADKACSLYTDTLHSVKIKVKNGVLSITIVGMFNEELKARIPANEAYLLMQSTSLSTYIDNFVIGDITEDTPIVQPEPKPETIKELTLNFEEESSLDEVEILHKEGWTIVDGRLHPVQEGVMYDASAFKLSMPFSLKETKYISFDFYSTAKTFDVGFLRSSASNMWDTQSLFIHLPYMDGTVGVNSYIDCTSGTYFGGVAQNMMDGKAHNMKIVLSDGKIRYWVDNQPLAFMKDGVAVEAFDAPSDYAYLTFRAVGQASFIDNLIISNSDIEYVPPVFSLEYDELSLDFSEKVDTYFAELGSSGWRVDDGAYYPNEMAWASVYLIQPVSFSGTKYISLDFLAVPNNGADSINSQFNMVFMSNITTFKTVAGMHAFMNSSTPVLAVNRAFNKGTAVGEMKFDWNDNKYHNLVIAIDKGTLTFFIDGQPVINDITGNPISMFVEVPTETDENGEEVPVDIYFALQATSPATRIDNFAITNEMPTYTPPTAEEKTPFAEKVFDFSQEGAVDGLKTLEGSLGQWQAKDGKISATATWGISYWDQKIPLDENKTVRFTFNLGTQISEEASVGFHQFNIGFSTSATARNGLFLMFIGDKLQFNYAMTPGICPTVNPVENRWFDGQDHELKFIVKNGKCAVMIDDEVVFKDVLIGQNYGYLKMQSTNTVDSISALKISNIADPLSIPNPDGDVSVAPDTSTSEQGKVSGKKKVDPLLLGLTIGLGVVTLAIAGGTVFVFVKKNPTVSEKDGETKEDGDNLEE